MRSEHIVSSHATIDLRYSTPAGAVLTDEESKRLGQWRSQLDKAIQRAQSLDKDLSLQQAIESLTQDLAKNSEQRRFVDSL